MRYAVLALLLAGCARLGSPAEAPPPALLGTFEDDYGIRYEITEREWIQQPNARYRIVRWRPEAGYLIAQNDAANPQDGDLWTRIDWVSLTDMAPYTWAFCLSAYDAPTAAAAEATRVADRSTPRTGCNGYPFSRMRPAPADSTFQDAGY
ncbi:MAG: hypothetical protein AAGI52_18080 [Bacteroidota bacterium]